MLTGPASRQRLQVGSGAFPRRSRLASLLVLVLAVATAGLLILPTLLMRSELLHVLGLALAVGGSTALAGWWLGPLAAGLLGAAELPLVAMLSSSALRPRAGRWLVEVAVAASLVAVAAGVAVGAARHATRQRRRLEETLDRQTARTDRALSRAFRRVRMEEALVECSRVLLNDAADTQLSEALAALGKAVGVDVVGVSRNVEHPELGLCSEVVHWLEVDRRPGGAERWELVPWSRLPEAAAVLATGEMHRFSRIAELPEEEQRLYLESPAGLRSALEIPIIREGRWVGHVMLGQHAEGRAWDAAELALVRTVADMFASAWARREALDAVQQAVAARDRSLRAERALVECSEALLDPKAERPVERAVAAVRQAAGVDGAYLDVTEEHPTRGPLVRTVCYEHSTTLPPDPSYFGEAPWSTWPNAYRVLAAGRPWSFPHPSELAAEERAYYEQPGRVRAELCYPVVVAGRFVGTVGLASAAPHRWGADEHRLLEAVSAMIGAFWEREEAHRRLQQLLQAKDQFLASVSHELRTPLSVVVGLASELADRGEDFPPLERAELSRLVVQQGREVADLVEDLLVGARAEEHQLTVVPEVCALDEAVTQVLHGLPAEVSERVTLHLQPVLAWADPLRTRQVIRNLVTNACRHGGPQVEVRVVSRSEWAVVEVSDDGPGIPDDEREAVFEAYRVASRQQGVTASIGLGLTVSRRLARLMAGEVEYRYDGHRSIFSLRLPQPAR